MPGSRYLSARPNLPVADVTAAREYYRANLGFETTTPTEGFDLAIIGRDGVEVALLGPEARFPDAGPASAYLTVEGVDALHEQVQAAGGVIDYPLTDEAWGLRNFVLKDADGNRLTLGEWVDGRSGQ
ncbi:MAG: VOC family protein [Dehalococcoidia bacterium]|nr:VOC family protein [Dehalococcoidia bacterium]